MRLLTTQEQRARVVMGSNTLKQRERVADTVRGRGCELRRVKKRVHRDDLLDQRGHNAWFGMLVRVDAYDML